jgi:hypothetical protein
MSEQPTSGGTSPVALVQGTESTPPNDQPVGQGQAVAPTSLSEALAVIQAAAAELRAARDVVPAPTPARNHEERLADLEQSVSMLAELAAEQARPETVEGMGQPTLLFGGQGGLDRLQVAFDHLLAGTRPPEGIEPLSGVRELYTLLSGDWEMVGRFNPDRVYLAAVTSATMANICANALNKVVVNVFSQYPKWWGNTPTEVDFSSLHDAKWISLGDVGELPTVSEGAQYTELTWDDFAESDSFVKKGGYLGITIEAIDKDDTARIMAVPRKLAQAAWLTLGKAIAAIHTDNSGYGATMSDSNYLYDDSNHSNLGSSALTWANYVTTKVAMMKQTAIHSGERLGAVTRPYYLWVPVDLETTALQVLASEGEPGTADNDINPLAAGEGREARLARARQRVVVCPFWTDTADWVCQADPNLYPGYGIGYRFGRTPEIFSVASPTAGLMFSNDTLPVKVRFFFAVGPTDWRAWYKHL